MTKQSTDRTDAAGEFERIDEMLDEAGRQSFPASDPPAVTPRRAAMALRSDRAQRTSEPPVASAADAADGRRPGARLPGVDAATPGVDAAVLQAVEVRRGGRLLNLDRQLLHSAPLAAGWNAYLGAIRSAGVLDGALRELVILLVATLNRAPYEFAHHAPVALAEHVSPAKIDGIARWRELDAYTPKERDVLAYAEAMTLHVQVDVPTFDAARRHFSDREMVELTATVAAYNMVSRFLEALGVELE